MSDEKAAAVKAEVQHLLDAKVIREVKYQLGSPTQFLSKRKMENGECV